MENTSEQSQPTNGTGEQSSTFWEDLIYTNMSWEMKLAQADIITINSQLIVRGTYSTIPIVITWDGTSKERWIGKDPKSIVGKTEECMSGEIRLKPENISGLKTDTLMNFNWISNAQLVIRMIGHSSAGLIVRVATAKVLGAILTKSGDGFFLYLSLSNRLTV